MILTFCIWDACAVAEPQIKPRVSEIKKLLASGLPTVRKRKWKTWLLETLTWRSIMTQIMMHDVIIDRTRQCKHPEGHRLYRFFAGFPRLAILTLCSWQDLCMLYFIVFLYLFSNSLHLAANLAFRLYLGARLICRAQTARSLQREMSGDNHAKISHNCVVCTRCKHLLHRTVHRITRLYITQLPTKNHTLAVLMQQKSYNSTISKKILVPV